MPQIDLSDFGEIYLKAVAVFGQRQALVIHFRAGVDDAAPGDAVRASCVRRRYAINDWSLQKINLIIRSIH